MKRNWTKRGIVTPLVCRQDRFDRTRRRIIRFALFLCAVAFVSISGCQFGSSPDAKLTSVEQIKRLSPAQLEKGYAVQLDGVVTFYDARWHLLVVQDSTGGVSVDIRSAPEGISPGDHIAVQGYTAYEGYVPVVVKPRVSRLGSSGLPKAPVVDANSIASGDQDFKLVQFDCRVRQARAVGIYAIEFEVEAGGHNITVYGSDFTKGPVFEYAGQDIRLRGVPVTIYDPVGKRHSLQIYTTGSDVIEVRSQSAPTATLTASSAGLPLLNSVKAIKDLSSSEAERGYPVRLRATITALDPVRRRLIVQDERAGVFVEVRQPFEELDSRLALASRIEVHGITGSGSFAPVIRQAALTFLGKGTLPSPVKLLPSEGFKGEQENIWAEVEGVVQSVTPDLFGGVSMQVVSGETRLLVIVPSKPAVNLVDNDVVMRGVFGPIFSGDRWLRGYQLQVPSMGFIKVADSSSGDNLKSPPRPIHSLREYSPKGFSRHRMKVEGQVTYVGEDGTVYLADKTGGIRLKGNLVGKLELNDHVQALGFFRQTSDRPTLEDTEVFPGGPFSQVTPQKITVEAALSGVHEGSLVEVEGFVRELHRSFGDRVFTIESGRSRFSAVLENAQNLPGGETLREGAMVRLVGVCVNNWDTDVVPPVPVGFTLLMRTPDDLAVLKSPPWWTLQRALLLVGVLGGVLLLAAAWLALLRHRVQAQTLLLRNQMEQRERLESQLRQAQKLESVGRLAGGIAHDFNNLLMVINGYSELALSELSTSSHLAQNINEIKKAGAKAALLTRQLLAFSRKQILQPVVIDLNTLVADMDEMLRRLIGEDIQLVILLSSEPCKVLADPGQLSQVLMNLAANARDSMPDGGKLIVETAVITIDAELAKDHAEFNPGEYVRLVVTDSGTGMDAETIAHVFEPFFTTKGLGRGTGLGLSTVFGIIKQSGGHIWVYSELGQGTTFKIHLPRTIAEDSSVPLAKDRSHKLGNETILVVEDQSDVRTLIVKSLSSQGYQVLETSNGHDALAVASRHVGPIHLLLTDVVMPGMSGKVLADEIVDIRPGIRVLYMSGYTENVVAHKGILDPGIDYLQKPFSSSVLCGRVREVLEKDRSIDDGETRGQSTAT